MHNFKALALSVFCFFSIPLFSSAQLEVRPDFKWKTLHTAHFEIIYNAKQQDLAHLYAEKLEQAHYDLKSYFHSFPRKTVVIINDKTDVTNGYATRIPYPHIMAYPVLPGPEDSLADTGDWAFELLAHEYTHILNFEPANGVMKPLRLIFGNIIAPNILLPQWWKEGLAVEMETRLGHQGRLRSFYQDATIRAMVEDQTFDSYDIAQANESIPTWPEGMRPYLFGSLMWSQMMADKQAGLAGQLNERHGYRVPYFIETPAREYLGHDYSFQYRRMIEETTVRAQAQLKTLREAPLSTIVIPQNQFKSVTAPAISPNGKHLAVITEDDGRFRSVKIITRESDEQSFLDSKSANTIEKFNEAFESPNYQDGPPTGSIQRISWFPSSEKVVYDKIDATNRIERFSDLYVYDLAKKKTTRLTVGLRGREPSVSPDGKSLVFVKLEGGRTHLALLNPENSAWKETLLVSPALQERISYPLFWDEHTLLFSWRKTDGQEHLFRYNLLTQQTERLLPEHDVVRFACKTSEGLLFTSGQSGVLNLYLTDHNLQNVHPVSHTLSAFFTADLDPVQNEIFATHMTSQGLKVAAITEKEWRKTPATLPQISPMMADRYQKSALSETALETRRQEVATILQQAKTEDYSAAGYLLPQYWFPFISGSSSETGVVLQAQTSGFDPLKKHTYALMASWDTGLNRGSLEGLYLNQVTALPLLASLYKRSSYLGTTDYELDDLGAALAALPDVFWLSKYASWQLGWLYMERETPYSTTKRTGPYTTLNYTNYSKAGEQISPESGLGAYIGFYNYIQQEGYLNHSQWTAGGEVYLSSFLPSHHALMLRINGLHTPEHISSVYGASTESLVFIPDSPLPQYILRGYRRGQVFGRNLISTNLEYRFPLRNIYRGSGTDPLFFRRLSGAFVADGTAAEGTFLNEKTNADEAINLHRSFWSTGAELKLETTLGYVIPVSLVLGYYVAWNMGEGSEGVLATTLQITGF